MASLGRSVIDFLLLFCLCCFYQPCLSDKIHCTYLPSRCTAPTIDNSLLNICSYLKVYPSICMPLFINLEPNNRVCISISEIQTALPSGIRNISNCAQFCSQFVDVCNYLFSAAVLNTLPSSYVKKLLETKPEDTLEGNSVNDNVPQRNVTLQDSKNQKKIETHEGVQITNTNNAGTNNKLPATGTQDVQITDTNNTGTNEKLPATGTHGVQITDTNNTGTNNKLPATGTHGVQITNTNNTGTNENLPATGTQGVQITNTNNVGTNEKLPATGTQGVQITNTNNTGTNEKLPATGTQGVQITNTNNAGTNQKPPGGHDTHSVENLDAQNEKGKLNVAAKKTNMNTAYSEAPSSAHFMGYFLTAIVLCIAGYIVFHNKQKIIAFIIEGRNQKRGRRPNANEYKKLEANVDDVMVTLDKSTTAQNYIY